MEDNEPWPRPCHRCGTWVDIEHSHVGHGWTMFCDSCEDSYNKWFESGKTDERRKQEENNEKAYKVLMEWIRFDPKQKHDYSNMSYHERYFKSMFEQDESTRDFFNHICKRCKNKATHMCWNTSYCEDHFNEFEQLKKDLNYIEG